MEDSCDTAFSTSKFLLSRMRSRPIPIENFAVEPWEKNTVEADKPQSTKKKYKTFYQSPSMRKVDHKNATQKVFTFRKQYTPLPSERQKAQTARKQWHATENPVKSKVAINPYNINGALLTQEMQGSTKKFSNQFHVKKQKSRAERRRDMSVRQHRQPQSPKMDYSKGTSAFEALKKRINIQRGIESTESREYVGLATDRVDDMRHLPVYPARRRSKIISVGYQKFACLNGLIKHRSASLGVAKHLD